MERNGSVREARREVNPDSRADDWPRAEERRGHTERRRGRQRQVSPCAHRLSRRVCFRRGADRGRGPAGVRAQHLRRSGEHRERLIDFLAQQNIALEFNERIAPAFGVSYGGKIALLPGQSKAEEFVTLVHETAHLCCAQHKRMKFCTKLSGAPRLRPPYVRPKPKPSPLS